MWSSRMFAGWAILIQIAILAKSLLQKEYIKFTAELIVIVFITISQRNAK